MYPLADRGLRETPLHERLYLVSFVLGQVTSGHEQLHLPVKELRLRHLAHFHDVVLRFEIESAAKRIVIEIEGGVLYCRISTRSDLVTVWSVDNDVSAEYTIF